MPIGMWHVEGDKKNFKQVYISRKITVKQKYQVITIENCRMIAEQESANARIMLPIK